MESWNKVSGKSKTALATLFCLTFGLLSIPQTFAKIGDPMYALVIGNASYDDAPLRNPVNDARDLSDMLGSLGFEVRLVLNARKAKIFQAVQQFRDDLALNPKAIGLLYFAGHGVQINGRNYLVPIDAQTASQEQLIETSVDLSIALSQMGLAGNRLNIVILDACRNNPYASDNAGLASIDAPIGTYIAYATAPGSVAIDIDDGGRNGAYTAELLKILDQPGLRLNEVFMAVRYNVWKKTAGMQVPWESSSMIEDFYFAAVSSVPSESDRAQLLVKTVPTDADIFVDKVSYGKGPSMAIELKPRRYTITVQKDDFVTEAFSVDLEAGHLTERSVFLEPLDGESEAAYLETRLTIQVSPVDAMIDVLGVVSKQGPKAELKVHAGVYELKVSRVGYVQQTHSVQLSPGSNVFVPIKLFETPALERLVKKRKHTVPPP